MMPENANNRSYQMTYKKGDSVIVIGPTVKRKGSHYEWVPQMDRFIGKKFVIDKSNDDDCYTLVGAGTFGFGFHSFWLKSAILLPDELFEI